MIELVNLESGVKQQFNTLDECKVFLYKKHICCVCRNGDIEVNDQAQIIRRFNTVNEYSSLKEILNTPCGFNFIVNKNEK